MNRREELFNLLRSKDYHTPRLMEWGSLQDLTRGHGGVHLDTDFTGCSGICPFVVNPKSLDPQIEPQIDSQIPPPNSHLPHIRHPSIPTP